MLIHHLKAHNDARQSDYKNTPAGVLELRQQLGELG